VIVHTEKWTLHRNVHLADWTDDELDRVLGPLDVGRAILPRVRSGDAF